MRIHPTQNYLLLDEVEEEAKTKGGIYIPERARMPLNQGVVIAAGPDTVDRNVLGKLVVFTQHSEFRLQIDNKFYLLVRETDVIAIMQIKTPPSE